MALVLDIETIGENFSDMDETTHHVLTRYLKKTSKTEADYNLAIDDLKNNLGFSPLTGEIVAIGVIDSETEQGAVYYQSPDVKTKDFEENGIQYKTMSEKEMLEKFWILARKYNEFVNFNGKKFDIPFLMIRSAINQVKPSKNLMSNRYLFSQKFDCKHIDLYDELTFYGAANIRGANLHMFSRAFKIESPKAQGVEGDDVAGLFKEKKYLDIAKYNALDIKATNKLFKKWEEYFRF